MKRRAPLPVATAGGTLLALALVGSGCLLSTEPTAAPPTTLPPSADTSPSAAPNDTDAESAEPARSPPGSVADVPLYMSGSWVETAVGGLRVRARPGTSERVVIGLLPEGAELLVALGPIWVDGFGWYLVNDSDRGEPKFDEGWVAAGFNPEPFLVPTIGDGKNPYLGGAAGDGDGEYGPFRLADAKYAIRWIAAPPTVDGCDFAVDLRPGSADAVPAIRATIGAVVAPGILYPDYFADHPELIGNVFLGVTSDCGWALAFVRQ